MGPMAVDDFRDYCSKTEKTSEMLDQLQHLLVPLNFADSNEIAIEAAIEIASTAPARVTLLHVIEPIDVAEDSEVQDFTEQLRSQADEQLLAREKRFSDLDITVTSENLIGSRATEIIRFANSNEVDMIILNSHRIQNGQPENALGKLSYQVAALASCAVLLLK